MKTFTGWFAGLAWGIELSLIGHVLWFHSGKESNPFVAAVVIAFLVIPILTIITLIVAFDD